jgi:plastocyanin
MRRVGIVLGAVVAALVATATPALAAEVAIQDFSFEPQTVGVEVGGSVTWTNEDNVTHTVTAEDGSFDSGNLNQGESATVTFDDAGTFPYFCQIHPFMRGTVQVGAQPIPGPTGSGTGTGTAIAGGAPTESLPQTATPLAVILLTGLGIVGAGLWLARRARPD